MVRLSVYRVLAGGLLGSVIPFTLLVILPTNRKLLNPALDKRSTETERLLSRWGTHCMPLEVCSADWRCCCSCTWRSSRRLTEQCEAQGRLRGEPCSSRSSLLKWGVGPGNIDRIE